MGIDGPADVLAIEPCPEIEAGRGRVVTGTFTTARCEVLELRLSSGEVLEPTPPHRFYSETRQDWVAARDLQVGEQLRTASGQIATIESIGLKAGEHRVYNLEVEHEHQFYVGEAGVLVHNGYATAEEQGLVRRPNGDVGFRGMVVEAQEDVTHLPQSTLEYMAEHGTAGRTLEGETITLHHVNQNPEGPLWEIPARLNDVNNPELHPFGNTPGAGLSPGQRMAFDNWREAYWRARANEELARRQFQQNGVF